MKNSERTLKEILNLLDSLTTDEIKKLLCLEKRRRGVKENDLVFLGTANIASYYWCSAKSLYTSIEDEPRFFHVYLIDRIIYSFKLNRLRTIPTSYEELLEIGNDIEFDDITKLLKQEIEQSESQATTNPHKGISTITTVDKNGNKVILINPYLPEDELHFWIEYAREENIRIVDLKEAPPITRGMLLETIHAEQYPTIRWNYAWDKYVIISAPDGITDKFVYEFKTTKSRFMMPFIKPVAFTQADLYGYFYKRKEKRVQIYVVEENETLTWTLNVDVNNVKSVLEKFKAMDNGTIPPPPKVWKCKSCEFNDICIIKKKKNKTN